MTVLFTPEELVLYLYNETTLEKKAAIEAALETDWTLREKLDVCKAASQNLDKIIESPRTEVIIKVLAYARETATEAVH